MRRARAQSRNRKCRKCSHEQGPITAIMGHANIEATRRIYAGDWREAEERNAIVLRQLADAGIGQ